MSLYNAISVASSKTSSYVFRWSASFSVRLRTWTRSSRRVSFWSSSRMGTERNRAGTKKVPQGLLGRFRSEGRLQETPELEQLANVLLAFPVGHGREACQLADDLLRKEPD